MMTSTLVDDSIANLFGEGAANATTIEEFAAEADRVLREKFGGLFGSHYTVFRQRLKDADVVKLNQKFNVRSLEYSVDLEQYSAIPESVVEAIKFNINIDENQSGYSQI